MLEQAILDFLSSLSADQRRDAVLPFESMVRFDWHYVPRERRGVPLKTMNDAQRRAAMAILHAALSERGVSRCEDIMRLETVLVELEQDPETYGPGNYVVIVFGHPGNGDTWGWRIEGHHLSLNFTHAREGVTVTPIFFGANPATVENGPLAGLRVLGAEEDLGRRLIRSFDGPRRERALIRTEAFDDILTGPGREASLRQPTGVALADMAGDQRDMTMLIIDQFLGAMQPAIAEADRGRLRAAGLDRIHFAWAGGLEPRQPHYYRLHGPTLVIEYDNTQNDANHIHSVRHDPQRDFGRDLLRHHYEHGAHAAPPRSKGPR
jgi:hypothetical protein